MLGKAQLKIGIFGFFQESRKMAENPDKIGHAAPKKSPHKYLFSGACTVKYPNLE